MVQFRPGETVEYLGPTYTASRKDKRPPEPVAPYIPPPLPPPPAGPSPGLWNPIIPPLPTLPPWLLPNPTGPGNPWFPPGQMNPWQPWNPANPWNPQMPWQPWPPPGLGPGTRVTEPPWMNPPPGTLWPGPGRSGRPLERMPIIVPDSGTRYPSGPPQQPIFYPLENAGPLPIGPPPSAGTAPPPGSSMPTPPILLPPIPGGDVPWTYPVERPSGIRRGIQPGGALATFQPWNPNMPLPPNRPGRMMYPIQPPLGGNPMMQIIYLPGYPV